ncbi:MAG: serine/threonine-protein kinase, partial [Verrucomicrobiota bacterium]
MKPSDDKGLFISVGDEPLDSSQSGGSVFVSGRVLADRYRIVSLLGRGGMGEVYRADDLKLNQSVALKFLPATLGNAPILLESLYNEVRAARRVSHPNVCRVYDIGQAEGLHFLSMEYIEGEDLESLLRRIGRLPRMKAIELARQLGAGLVAAHDEGLVHLDLKPANLMIDGRGNLRITDFGLARLAEDSGELRAGTPFYMAPEHF